MVEHAALTPAAPEPDPVPEPPLVAELRRHWDGEQASFHMPGHKGGSGASALARQVLGDAAYLADVSEIGGFDYLHAPERGVADAQREAAELFGAGHTFFLVNGSTGGNLAALMACVPDGEALVTLRGSHRSVFAAVAITGAVPRYVPMRHDPVFDGWFVGDPAGVEALATAGGPRLAAIHVTRPNYYGMCCDLAPYLAAARRLGIPLIVDEAHGSHFGLHPDLPPSALSLGADLVIQSTHKTLGSLTQSSMLHVRDGAPVDLDRLAHVLQMLQSSSPSALLTLSLDLAREHAARSGRALLGQAIDLAEEVRETARSRGLVSSRDVLPDGVVSLDPTKVVIDVTPLGLTGFEAAAQLRREHRVGVDLADFRRIACSITIGDSTESVHVLAEGIRALSPVERRDHLPRLPGAFEIPEMVETPRRATSRDAESVPLADAAGRVSAEYLIPYPPGVPLVVPGERLDDSGLAAVSAFRAAGSRIVGPADPTGATVRVVK